MQSVGSHGYSWSSSMPAGSAEAHNWLFYYNGPHPNYSNARGYGFQLRCLQE
ncbi:MAG: hypothetical protein K2K83_06855 [Rikenella sp.]|nr:hypothetical protein [Rikenella sp.]